MDITREQREAIESQLDGTVNGQPLHERFFDLAGRLGLDSPEGINRLLKANKISNGRLLWSLPETVQANVAGAAALSGIDKTALIDLFLGVPSIFGMRPENFNEHLQLIKTLLNLKDTKAVIKLCQARPALLSHGEPLLRSNMAQLQEGLGITSEDVIKMVKGSPPIITVKPQGVVAHADTLATLLGIERSSLIKAAIKEPSVLTQEPSTIDGQIAATAEALGVDKSAYVKAALKASSLLSLTKERVLGNVSGTCDLLGISMDQFLPMALKQPQLLTMKPATIENNVAQSCELLGATRDEFMRAAKQMPPLLVMNPETLDRHATLLQRHYRASGQQVTKAELLIGRPSNLCRADSALLGRFLVEQHGLMKDAPSLIIRKPNSVIENAVSNHYVGRLAEAETPKQAAQLTRTMQQLHRLKVIKELPDGIEPMAPRSR